MDAKLEILARSNRDPANRIGQALAPRASYLFRFLYCPLFGCDEQRGGTGDGLVAGHPQEPGGKRVRSFPGPWSPAPGPRPLAPSPHPAPLGTVKFLDSMNAGIGRYPRSAIRETCFTRANSGDQVL